MTAATSAASPASAAPSVAGWGSPWMARIARATMGSPSFTKVFHNPVSAAAIPIVAAP